MISPALIAAAADKGAGALTPEDLIQNENMPAYLQQQNNAANANLPQQQANAYQADTAGKLVQNQEAAAQLPLYLQYIAKKQAAMNGVSQPPQSVPTSQGNSQQSPDLGSLYSAANQEKNMNAIFPQMPSQDAQIAYQRAMVATKMNLDNDLATGINPKAPLDPKTGQPMTWQSQALALGPGKTNAAGGLADQYIAQHPEINYLPDAEKANYTKDKLFSAPQQPNMGVLSEQNISPSIVNNAAKRILAGNSTIAEETTKGRLYGPQALEFHDALLTAVQGQDPSFSEADNEGQRAFANSPQTKKAISQLDNAYSTVAHLRDVYSKLNNTQFPTVNAAINGGKLQVGDVDQAAAAINQALGNDELTQAFARGGQPTDKLRGLSAILADKNLSPQQQGAQFNEILAGLQRSRAAYAEGGGKFVKPLNLPSTQDPQTQAAIAWAKANPNDPRAAAVLKKAGQ